VADDWATLNRKLGDIASQLQGPSMRKVTTRVATRAKKVALGEYRRAVGADLRLSNWRRGTGAGVKIGVGFDLVSDHAARIRPRPSGPAKVVEDGSLAHAIESRAAKISGKGAARARRAQDLARTFGGRGAFAGTRPMPIRGGFAYRVKHPGSRGKRAWSQAVAKVDSDVARWVNDEVGTVLSRALK